MSFDGLPGRLRQLERALAPSGVVVAVFLPSDSPEERAQKEAIITAARARGRELVEVRIGGGRAMP